MQINGLKILKCPAGHEAIVLVALLNIRVGVTVLFPIIFGARILGLFTTLSQVMVVPVYRDCHGICHRLKFSF